jgi:hypothetical protein
LEARGCRSTCDGDPARRVRLLLLAQVEDGVELAVEVERLDVEEVALALRLRLFAVAEAEHVEAHVLRKHLHAVRRESSTRAFGGNLRGCLATATD